MYLRFRKTSEREVRAQPAWLRHKLRLQHQSPVLCVKLDLEEIQAAFGDGYPPILSLEAAAALAGWAPGTLKRKVSEGRFKSSVSRRRPLRFWTARFIQEVMK